jgi:large subunit ribosomal protein L24
MRIKKDDKVVILTGRDRGRQGKVLELVDDRQRVRVEGINMVKRHVKAGSDPSAPQGGIIESAALIHISNVRLFCNHCSKPTVAKVRKLESGKLRRYCPKCNESVDNA